MFCSLVYLFHLSLAHAEPEKDAPSSPVEAHEESLDSNPETGTPSQKTEDVPVAPTEDTESAEPVQTDEPAALEEHWARLTDDVLVDQIASLHNSGKTTAAQERIQHLLNRNPSPQFFYLEAFNLELQERYSDALTRFRDLLQDLETESTEASEELILDLRFRIAIVLDDLGAHKEARDMFLELRGHPDLLEGDLEKLQLLIGAVDMKMGKTRKGLRRIRRILKNPPTDC